jgi:hypothetical protein
MEFENKSKDYKNQGHMRRQVRIPTKILWKYNPDPMGLEQLIVEEGSRVLS